MAFCHLHVHSEYSLLDGANRIKPLVAQAKRQGQTALALTDHGNMIGAYEFHRACVADGVRPIIGCEVYVAPKGRLVKERSDSGKRAWHLLLLAQNQQGYRNLMQLVSRGYLEGFYYSPRVDHELLKEHSEGLICCTACISGEVPLAILEQKLDVAKETIQRFQGYFGEDNVYLEVMANTLEPQRVVNAALNQFSQEMSVPLVATADCHYLTKHHHAMQDVMLCIQTGRKYADTDRFRMESNEFWLKSEEEMRAELPDFGHAIERTVELAERCEVDPRNNERKYYLPSFPLPEERAELTELEYLRELVWEGIETRYDEVTEEIRARTEYELGVIEGMGFAGYFLIVWDFIRYAREIGVGVGPGRGSAAGSIVAYALRIVDVDPLRFDLLFERFLNPDRISMPDIDIDFDDRRRHEVIEYVTKRYRRECVAYIVTIGRIKAKNAIRDVGRALDVPLPEVNRLAAMIPDGPNASLAKALHQEKNKKDDGESLFNPDLVKESRKSPQMKQLFSFAEQLEGIGRNIGVHAAGVVIGDRPLVELVPLIKTAQDEVATQFTMETLEELGLLKMDFLGLRNLSVIDDTVRTMSESGVEIDWDALDYKDDATYELLCQGNTDGVFQVESDGMKSLLRQLKPNCFDDIIAVLALYRPGPLNAGYTKGYVDAKNGRTKVTYADTRMEPILRDTYGVLVYQEQVMLLANVLAGFTLAQADALRKAMGKKKKEVMEKLRVQFVDGCEKNGMARRVAEDLYNNIVEFAKYCFNKSHTAAYAVLTFRTAYLKAHYPKEFMASLLTSEVHNTAKLLHYIRDAAAQGLQLLPPDINQSGPRFTPVPEGIRYGLAAIKGVGEGLVERICADREANGPFKNVEDFCRRLEGAMINSKLLECLVLGGAFDSFGLRRSQLLDLFPKALEMATTDRRNKELYGGDLFGGGGGTTSDDCVLEVPDIAEIARVTLLQHEKDLLGLYVSGHPIDDYRDDLALVSARPLVELADLSHRTTVRVAGVMSEFKKRKFSSGDMRGEALLEDGTAACPLLLPEELLIRHAEQLVNFGLLLIDGVVERQDDNVRVRARAVNEVGDIRSRLIRGVHVGLRPEDVDREALARAREIVRACPGQAKLYFHLARNGSGNIVIRAGDDYTLTPSTQLLDRLKECLRPIDIRFDLVGLK